MLAEAEKAIAVGPTSDTHLPTPDLEVETVPRDEIEVAYATISEDVDTWVRSRRATLLRRAPAQFRRLPS